MNRLCVVVVVLSYVGGCAAPPPATSSKPHPTPASTAKRIVAQPTPTPSSDDVHIARTQDGRFEATGVLLRTPNFHGTVSVRDLKTKRVVATWNNPGGATGLSFSPDGTLLAVNSPSRVDVWKWRQKQRAYAHVFDTSGGQFRIESAFSPNGKQLAVAFGSLVVLDVGTWKEHDFPQLAQPSFVRNVTWAPNSRVLATIQDEIGAYSFVEPRNKRVRSLGGIDSDGIPVFSPDSRFMAGNTESGRFMWNVRSGRRYVLNGNFDEAIIALTSPKNMPYSVSSRGRKSRHKAHPR